MLPDVYFVFVGGTADDVLRLKNYGAEKSTGNLIFTGHQPIKSVSRYLYAADSLIIPPASAALIYGRTVLPFKTFLYLAAGRPIVAPRQPDLTEVLVHEHNAMLMEPDDIAGTAKILERLFSEPALHLAICENAAASAKNLTWEDRARKIIEWLTKVYYHQDKHGAQQAAKRLPFSTENPPLEQFPLAEKLKLEAQTGPISAGTNP
jgi:glycosyltransferase involved in cell wall biosynthesis